MNTNRENQGIYKNGARSYNGPARPMLGRGKTGNTVLESGCRRVEDLAAEISEGLRHYRLASLQGVDKICPGGTDSPAFQVQRRVMHPVKTIPEGTDAFQPSLWESRPVVPTLALKRRAIVRPSLRDLNAYCGQPSSGRMHGGRCGELPELPDSGF